MASSNQSSLNLSLPRLRNSAAYPGFGTNQPVASGVPRINAVHSRDRSLTQGKLQRVGSHIRRDPEEAANAKSGLWERNGLTYISIILE